MYPGLPVVEHHLDVELLEARRPRRDTDGRFPPRPDDFAGQVADKGLEVGAGVEVLPLDLDPGAARLRTVSGLNVGDHRVDESE